jgi:hypothetical protein
MKYETKEEIETYLKKITDPSISKEQKIILANAFLKATDDGLEKIFEVEFKKTSDYLKKNKIRLKNLLPKN